MAANPPYRMRFEYDIATLLFVPTLTRIVPAKRIRRIYQGLIHRSAWKVNSPEVRTLCCGLRPLEQERQYVRLEFVWYAAISDAPTS